MTRQIPLALWEKKRKTNQYWKGHFSFDSLGAHTWAIALFVKFSQKSVLPGIPRQVEYSIISDNPDN